MTWTKESLWNLRKEIVFNSLYYADYRNSFGVDEHKCCDFFDGYGWQLHYLMECDGREDVGNKYWLYFDEYDNAENLWNFYCDCSCDGNEPLPIEEEI